MSIPNDDCSQCCTCPTATVEWDSSSAALSKNGYYPYTYDGAGPYPPDIYLTETVTGEIDEPVDAFGEYSNQRFNGVNSFAPSTGILTSTGLVEWSQKWQGRECVDMECSISSGDYIRTDAFPYGVEKMGCYSPPDACDFIDCGPPCYGFLSVADTATVRTITLDVSSPTTATAHTRTLSDLFTDGLLLSSLAFPPFSGAFNSSSSGSFLNFDGVISVYARKSRYRIRFKIPTVNTAKNFRAIWAERFIAEGGVSISSVSVYTTGVYRPTVTLSAPPTGGTQAYATIVMSSTGTVSSIAILNPGSGYVSAPTVTIQSATGGGTSSTGWTATLTAGSVAAISGGSAGDYRPTLAFSSGGGSGATATCTLDSRGGIASVTVTASGSAYTSEPTLTITPKVTGSTASDLLVHLGTETARCTVWDGATPGGYVAATPSTWPILPSASPYYFELPVPSSDGTTLVANLRTVCDGSSC